MSIEWRVYFAILAGVGLAKVIPHRAHHQLKDNRGMNGVQFVTDEKGRKVAVQLDLKKHRELWQDIEDVLVSRSRRNEKRIPLDRVKAGLAKSGKLAR